MNQQAYEDGRAAYRRGDVAVAIAQLTLAKQPGEVSGSVDHLLGNCLMRQGRFAEAAQAYGDALRDASYGNTGALACNRGRALLAADKPQEAVASLTMALKDETYATPYKANIALGNAYLKLNNPRDAGVAFRNAAIDETNPDPSSALRELGGCFMQMGRAIDAIEAYRTALDFSAPLASQNATYAELGLAYVAANRMSEAVDAFGQASSDGSYELTSEQKAAYEAAQRAVAGISNGPSETDALLAAAGYGTGSMDAVDPLDPLGKSGEFMPSPEDTGFFSVSESELVAQEREDRKVRRKHSHSGLKAFLIFLLVILLIAGVGGIAYFNGFGWPTQEAVTEQLFTKASSGDITSVVARALGAEGEAQILSVLPTSTSSVKVTGVDRTMSRSTVFATATLSAGGSQSYEVEMIRDGIGWKVVDVSVAYPALDGEEATLSSSATSVASTAESVTSAAEAPAEPPAEPAEGEEAPEEDVYEEDYEGDASYIEEGYVE